MQRRRASVQPSLDKNKEIIDSRYSETSQLLTLCLKKVVKIFSKIGDLEEILFSFFTLMFPPKHCWRYRDMQHWSPGKKTLERLIFSASYEVVSGPHPPRLCSYETTTIAYGHRMFYRHSIHAIIR